MAGDTLITIVGNLTSDPELRFTPSGAAVANFTIASTPRSFDKSTDSWKDGETLFMRCSVWRDQAEFAAESLTRGSRVIALGRLKSRSFDTKEGEKRTVLELDVEEVGPSLKNATAKVARSTRSQPAQQGQSRQKPVEVDPWATQPAGSVRTARELDLPDPWATGGTQDPHKPVTYDEPPF